MVKNLRIVAVPALGDSPICSVGAIKAMHNTFPSNNNAPPFSIRQAGQPFALADSIYGKHLKLVGRKLHHLRHLTFHVFLTGGKMWGLIARYHVAWNLVVQCFVDLHYYLHYYL